MKESLIATDSSMSVWTSMPYYGLGAFILILLVMMLLHYERIRIIFIPVDWFQFPKGLKESFKYNECPCPVREYCHVPESDSESSDCSTCSGNTDQSDCSVSIPVNESDLPTSCSSSTSTVSPEEEKQDSICADPESILFLFDMMATRLLLFLCLTGHVFAKEPPVKFNPPTNVIVRCGLDSNLWLNWTQISHCVESEVRYRINSKAWMTYPVRAGIQNYCINLPSSALYELQVRSKLDYYCGGSRNSFWSDWSEPVFWGSKNNSTDAPHTNSSMSVWTPVLSGFGAFFLILLVMMLLHYERIRIILIPVVPKPSLPPNVEDWFQFPKGLKESFKDNERPCPVREYCHVPESDSESSDCSTCSGNTDQTDCSVSIPVNESDLPTSCSSSTSTVSPEEEKQDSV
ncbi:hypothetical protein F7725_006922 [Dissostichus mawsoni]|uniref:Fibronectin type-III domain-containing protein n=1 Tax=Dissostichus mawsoni TaxID=36200 RepID=A0A7J5XV97_DISMA|nr:hypothetical protein F7725_006922 [Dissostichus mawsoni]